MVAVIINADDFGLSDGVCRSVHELFDANAISSTTLMVAADGAVERFRRFRPAALVGAAGIHLQLTGGSPVSSAPDVPSLVDPLTGRFRDPRKPGASPCPEQVLIEWRRQIEVGIEALGGAPTHLDSHHGMHRRTEFFDVYVELAREFDIPFRGAVGKLGEMIRAEGLPGTVALVSDWTGRQLGADVLIAQFNAVLLSTPSETVAEIICHPGHLDEYLKSVSSLAEARESDHAGVMELRRRNWPEVEGHRRSSFREIWRPGLTWR